MIWATEAGSAPPHFRGTERCGLIWLCAPRVRERVSGLKWSRLESGPPTMSTRGSLVSAKVLRRSALYTKTRDLRFSEPTQQGPRHNTLFSGDMSGGARFALGGGILPLAVKDASPASLGCRKQLIKGSKLRKPRRSPALAQTHGPAHTQFAPALPPSQICFWENKS